MSRQLTSGAANGVPAAVSVEHLWKRFRTRELHDSLRDLLPALARAAVGRGRPPGRGAGGRGRAPRAAGTHWWALRDVSFEVAPGEAFGIIGPNGAGKSTMLKLLTGILEPTGGDCRVRGRVGALIELAAGFHPDLTGRQNVYLQGALMGMPRAEVARKLDAIVEFAGLARFIDTPVKRFSSGMQARLGFAVAAHLDPDVLLVDEVLAVGDAAFQQRALARVRELVAGGTAVVLVSHQLEQVVAMCSRALLLEGGAVAASGPARECVARYLRGTFDPEAAARTGSALHVHRIQSLGGDTVPSGGRLTFRVEVAVRDPARAEVEGVAMRLRSAVDGTEVYATDARLGGVEVPRHGTYTIEASLQFNLPRGPYVLDAYVVNHLDARDTASGPRVMIDVTGGDDFVGTVQLNAEMRLARGADTQGADTQGTDAQGTDARGADVGAGEGALAPAARP